MGCASAVPLMLIGDSSQWLLSRTECGPIMRTSSRRPMPLQIPRVCGEDTF